MIGKTEWTFEDYKNAIEYWERLAKDGRIFADYKLDELTEEIWQFFPQECVMIGLSK